jgi:hypothetical protein
MTARQAPEKSVGQRMRETAMARPFVSVILMSDRTEVRAVKVPDGNPDGRSGACGALRGE